LVGRDYWTSHGVALRSQTDRFFERQRKMAFLSLLTSPVRRRLSVIDWIMPVGICYACILTMGIFLDGFSIGDAGNALFMMLLGFIGPVIGLLDSYYAPLLIPLFIMLSVIWGGMFYVLMRFPLIRFIQVSIITVFLMTFLAFGMFGIVSTQVI
jgi:hypothetical protein